MGELTGRNAQRAAALDTANARRRERAKIRRRIGSGELDPIKLVRGDYEDLEPELEPWKLRQLVALVPGIGDVTALEIWQVARMSPNARVRSLSYERRAELARLCEQGSTVVRRR